MLIEAFFLKKKTAPIYQRTLNAVNKADPMLINEAKQVVVQKVQTSTDDRIFSNRWAYEIVGILGDSWASRLRRAFPLLPKNEESHFKYSVLGSVIYDYLKDHPDWEFEMRIEDDETGYSVYKRKI
ncbi:hypothetical protein H1S01_19900 [Heliobacterium chlorum]|uniref:Uncharacterized protein n=1 Tax=Heliobacterium chlorum TaxID=2698 RepID=A0ABR7T7E9_HELCL|nr:hypothetical protein [Heliobacterium chlorum]MBC9786707.1 hypothetical protein [Heliobacterium chlorum]